MIFFFFSAHDNDFMRFIQTSCGSPNEKKVLLSCKVRSDQVQDRAAVVQHPLQEEAEGPALAEQHGGGV